MTALTADKDVDRKLSGLQSIPVEDDVVIYKGALVNTNSSGYLKAGADTITEKFMGIAYEKKDNSVSGHSQGGISCRVHTEGVFLLVCTSITQAMVGQYLFLKDDQTVDDSSTNLICVGRLVQYVSATLGWVDIGQRSVSKGLADHLHIRTDTDTKNVRIQSRDYTATSGDSTAGQTKPNASVTGTLGLTGWEFSPRFADGVAGSKLVGVMSNPILKGTTGDLSSAMRCYEAKLESDSGSTRTVAEAYCLHCMQALHGTVTTGPYPICVDAGGGNVAWAGFAKLPDDSQVAKILSSASQGGNIDGWIKVRIGAQTLYIGCYDAAPA